MKKKEMRETEIRYCDICGKETQFSSIDGKDYCGDHIYAEWGKIQQAEKVLFADSVVSEITFDTFGIDWVRAITIRRKDGKKFKLNPLGSLIRLEDESKHYSAIIM